MERRWTSPDPGRRAPGGWRAAERAAGPVRADAIRARPVRRRADGVHVAGDVRGGAVPVVEGGVPAAPPATAARRAGAALPTGARGTAVPGPAETSRRPVAEGVVPTARATAAQA